MPAPVFRANTYAAPTSVFPDRSRLGAPTTRVVAPAVGAGTFWMNSVAVAGTPSTAPPVGPDRDRTTVSVGSGSTESRRSPTVNDLTVSPVANDRTPAANV